MLENLLLPKISAGYCSDYRYPSTGTQEGDYDSEEDTLASCKSKCLPVLPASTSFYLKNGNQCGCSATTFGACSITSSSSYVSYKIVTGFKVPVLIHENCTP